MVIDKPQWERSLAGVVLAGGQSRRMGQDKSLMAVPQQKENLLNQSLTLLKSVKHQRPENVYISGEQHVNGIVDVFPKCGPLSGIHSALEHIQKHAPDITEILFVAVDMPMLTAFELNLLVESGRKYNSVICFENHYLPLYVPLSDQLYRQLTKQLQGSQALNSDTPDVKNKSYSLRKFLDTFSGKQIPVNNPHTLTNINTQQQWHLHCKQFR